MAASKGRAGIIRKTKNNEVDIITNKPHNFSRSDVWWLDKKELAMSHTIGRHMNRHSSSLPSLKHKNKHSEKNKINIFDQGKSISDIIRKFWVPECSPE